MPRLRLPRREPPPQRPPEDVMEDLIDEDGHGGRRGFFEHLDELRYRLVRASIALVIGVFIGVFLADPALNYLVQPYCDAVRSNLIELDNVDELTVTEVSCRLQTLGPTTSVVVYFRVALLIGAIIAIPVMTYQLLMFIFPGLTGREKRLVLLSIPAVTMLFLVGVAFAWFVLMRPALGFLEGFQRDLFQPEWTADLYLSFVTSLIFWMGVAFETPLIFFVLGLLGLISPGPLVRHWRIAIVGASIAAALITPTVDPVNMSLVMGPLLVLYVISIFLVYFARKLARIEDEPR